MSADEYRTFAADYHWFFGDTALRLGSDVPGVRAALARLAPASRVLDAACGIGLDAGWLLRNGHTVVATDASPAMADATQTRLAADGWSDTTVACCVWSELRSSLGAQEFDAVLCTGSAIAHAPDAAAMTAAFGAFHSILRPGGVLIVDTHDWDLVLAAGDRTAIDPGVISRHGKRAVRTYSWHLPATPGEPAVFEPAVIVLDGDRATRRSFPIRLWPFTRQELRERLAASGFDDIGLDVMPGDDRYTAVATRPRTG